MVDSSKVGSLAPNETRTEIIVARLRQLLERWNTLPASILTLLGTTLQSFMLTFLGSADAATARSNLGASTVLFGHLFGLTLSNNAGDATNDIDIAVGEATDTTGVAVISLGSALTKQLDADWAVGTNQGMRAITSISNDTWHIFLIRRPDTGIVDIAADTSASGTHIPGVNVPAEYTQKRRIGSIVRSGGAIKAFTQDGDEFLWLVPVLDINQNNVGTSAQTVTMTVPVGIVISAIHSASLTAGAATNAALFTPLSTTDTVPGTANGNIAAVGGDATATSLRTRTNTSAQIRTRVFGSDAGQFLQASTYGWVDTRGRLS